MERSGYYRLIAFWATCEAFAGGLMHAFKIPFTGMIIGSLSVTSILLIGHYYPGRANILRATLLVCIVKAMLSPHSPPTAYIAVGFQGIMGSLLFSVSRLNAAMAMLLGALALMESAMQRILVLWLIYGNRFWGAVDAFLIRLGGGESAEPVSGYVALIYIGIHGITGLMVGRYIRSVIAQTRNTQRYRIPENMLTPELNLPEHRNRKKRRWALVLIWCMITLLLLQSYFFPESALIGTRSAWLIVLRAAFLLGLWYALLGPLMRRWIRGWMERAKHRNLQTFNSVYDLLPRTLHLIKAAWQLAGMNRKGPGKLDEFFRILVCNIRPQS